MEITKTAESEVRSWLTELYPEKGEIVSCVASPIIEEDVPTSIHDANRAKQSACTSASKIDNALRRKLRKTKWLDRGCHTNIRTSPSGSLRPIAGQVTVGSDNDDCDSKVGSIKRPRNLTNFAPQNAKNTDTKRLSKSAKKRLKKRLLKKTDT